MRAPRASRTRSPSDPHFLSRGAEAVEGTDPSREGHIAKSLRAGYPACDEVAAAMRPARRRRARRSPRTSVHELPSGGGLRCGRPARSSAKAPARPATVWWAVRDSNPRHPACKAGALPAELTARKPQSYRDAGPEQIPRRCAPSPRLRRGEPLLGMTAPEVRASGAFAIRAARASFRRWYAGYCVRSCRAPQRSRPLGRAAEAAARKVSRVTAGRRSARREPERSEVRECRSGDGTVWYAPRE